MTLPTITAAEAKARLDYGLAVLVDVREAAEHARESVQGSISMPLSNFDAEEFSDQRGPAAPALIFHCQSGVRTAQNAGQFAACGNHIYILEGGLDAWKRAGFPTVIDRSKPIEMQRQVQIAAGSLVVAGLGLCASVSHWFFFVPAFVGCGLVFAGVSGWCGMARLLAVMPWNRTAA
jgi:rhodanese-related sulfurtransferase